MFWVISGDMGSEYHWRVQQDGSFFSGKDCGLRTDSCMRPSPSVLWGRFFKGNVIYHSFSHRFFFFQRKKQ